MLEFSSDISVQFVQSMGDDWIPAHAARASTGQDMVDTTERADRALIKLLADSGHTSPFEHLSLTVRVDAPLFVAAQWMRHRTQSYSMLSGRWQEHEGKFYVPSQERPIIQVGRTGEYRYIPGSPEQVEFVRDEIMRATTASFATYQRLIHAGVAKEVARMVLPENKYTTWWATASFVNWTRFLRLRDHEHAQYEIRFPAEQVRQILHELFPVCCDAWGLGSPVG